MADELKIGDHVEILYMLGDGSYVADGVIKALDGKSIQVDLQSGQHHKKGLQWYVFDKGNYFEKSEGEQYYCDPVGITRCFSAVICRPEPPKEKIGWFERLKRIWDYLNGYRRNY